MKAIILASLFIFNAVAEPIEQEAVAPQSAPGTLLGGDMACLQKAVGPNLPTCAPEERMGEQVAGSEISASDCAKIFSFFSGSRAQTPDPASVKKGMCRLFPKGDAPPSADQQTRAANATQQCLAIWHATKDLTQFVNPGGRRVANNNNGSNQNQNNGDGEGDGENQNGQDGGNNQQRQRQSQGSSISINGMECVGRDEFDLDFPACKKFAAWYNGLKIADMGLQAYNQNAKVQAGQKGIQEAQVGMAKGDYSGAYTAQQGSLNAEADAQNRLMAFNFAQAAAITAQLKNFPNRSNVTGKCSRDSQECCQAFASMNSADTYFPNAGMKAMMTAEVARALGSALAAKLAADAAKRQSQLVGAIKDQITDGTTDDPGLINNYCQLNPQDARCSQVGTGGVTPPGNFGGNSFTSEDFGSDSFGQGGVITDDSSTGSIGDSSNGSIGDVGDIGGGAKSAKATFDAPGAGASIGAPAAGGSGAGGGGTASAASPGLSKDPGVQGEQKPADTKVTSLGAAYNGAAYSGGAFRGGGDRKPAAAENPFASLFGKDKDNAQENIQIGAKESELWKTITDRYNTVVGRKDLMEVK